MNLKRIFTAEFIDSLLEKAFGPSRRPDRLSTTEFPSIPSYSARAWVNFNATTTPPAIRASGNVSSITRETTGLHRVNFITPMPDANYSAISDGAESQSDHGSTEGYAKACDLTTTSFRIITKFHVFNISNRNHNNAVVCAVVFR